MKKLVTTLFLLMTTYSFSYTEIKNEALLPILTPSFSEQKVLKLRLDNGLEAIIISDPSVDKSGAVLSVQVGSWEDPKEHPGIAHFLEHMLFMGTKKYPDEKEYHRFIQDHGGLTNAFTANHITSYIFSIDNFFFDEALDRFSQFFKEPLFNPSGVNRELRAIDQEYEMNVQKDDVREYFVYKALSDPSHPNSHFNIGSSETLKNVSQKELIDWYKKHYSANLMRLIVISPKPLNELKELVVNDFSGIPNTNKNRFLLDVPYTQSSVKGKMVVIEPLKDKRSVTAIWELPSKIAAMHQEKPGSLLCHILGHEGEESLLAELKRENLATGITCGSSSSGAINSDLMIEITLTDKGFQQVNDVIYLLFQTINMLKNEGFPKELYDEINAIEKLKYQYQQREDIFSFLMYHGMTLNAEPIATYPEETKITKKYDPTAIQNLLNYMTPKNAVFFLTAPKDTGFIPNLKEKWLKVNYSIEEIDPKLLADWENAPKNPAITIPTKNPFLPTTLEVTEVDKDLKNSSKLIPTPEVIIQNDHQNFYFCKDTKFKEPKVNWYLEIKTPQVNAFDPLKSVMADIYVKLLSYSLKKYSYPAEMAGLQYQIKQETNGISIRIVGFNDKAEVLLKNILETIKYEDFAYSYFSFIKKDLYRKYRNFSKESPLATASEYLRESLFRNYVNENEKANAIKKVNLKLFKHYVRSLFNKTYLQGLFYGNNSKDEIKDIIQKFDSLISGHNYPLAEHVKKEIINLPKDSGPFFIESNTEMQGNATILAIESTPYSIEKRVAQDIIMQGMKEPFFSELRTKQQTGYIATNYGIDFEKHLFSLFAVQSVTHDPRDLLARFELFIEDFLQEIELKSLPEERFETIKNATIKTLQNPAKSLTEMGNILSTLAFEMNGDFDWIDKRISTMQNLNYNEFVILVREMLGRKNSQRLGILIKGISPENKAFHYQTSTLKDLKKLSTFSGFNQ